MYQNCTTGQLQLALQYELKVASDHIVNLINDFVNSIPNEVLLDGKQSITIRLGAVD